MTAVDYAPLPLAETVAPTACADAVEAVREAVARRQPIYPIGGGTALTYGTVPKSPGLGLLTTGLNRVVDYPARDMTITVEAGLAWAELARVLTTEGQRLPVDPPQAHAATVGGVVAANVSGPRRFGYGTIRDYVIGIEAIDGHATLFHGGGRVVKNVAGYDFCKLLAGSLGTLAVVTRVTFKVRPVAADTAFVATAVDSVDAADRLLDRLTTTRTTPVAVEWLAGPAWRQVEGLADWPRGVAGTLAVGFEGSAAEVDWQVQQLADEWRAAGVAATHVVREAAADRAWAELVEFPVRPAAVVIRMSVTPCAVPRIVELAARTAPAEATIQAHAGSGAVFVRLPEGVPAELSALLVKQWQPAAVAARGHAVIWHSQSPEDWTHQAVWGPARADYALMARVKKAFDPHGLLNPGRAAYPT
jgi:glycolate oxidase FAD binding subunit